MDDDEIKNQIDLKKYSVIKEVNHGNFGVIYLIEEKATNKKYAAKVNILDVEDKDYTKCVLREIKILANVNLPTIIGFQGYSLSDFDDKPNITILLDYVENGSLVDVLAAENSKTMLDNTKRQIILAGIAHGMMTLHSLNIIHRDLKPGNILIDDNLYPRITDFGMSKYFDPNNPNQQSTWGGTPFYEAPEIWKGEDYDTSVDVYAFGLLMYEVVTGIPPFSELGNINKARFRTRIVKNQYRPPFETPIKESIKEIIEKCWSNNPFERPTFEELYNALSLSKSKQYSLEGVDFKKFQKYIDYINSSGASANSEMMNQLRHEISIMRRQVKKLHLDNKRFRDSEKKLLNQPLKKVFSISQTGKMSDSGILYKLKKMQFENDLFDPFYISTLSSRDPYNVLIPSWRGFYSSSENEHFFFEIQLRESVSLTGFLIQSDEKGNPRNYTINVNDFHLISVKDDESMRNNHFSFHKLGKSVTCSKFKFIQDGKNWDGKDFIRIKRIEFYTKEYPLKAAPSLQCKGLFANMRYLYKYKYPHLLPVQISTDVFSCEEIEDVKTNKIVGTDHALNEFCEFIFTKGLVKIDSYRLKRTKDKDTLKGWEIVGTTLDNKDVVISSINEKDIAEHNLIDYFPSKDNESLFKSVKIVNTTENWNGNVQKVLRFHHIEFFGEYYVPQ